MKLKPVVRQELIRLGLEALAFGIAAVVAFLVLVLLLCLPWG